MLFGICFIFGVKVFFCINNGVVVVFIKIFFIYLKGERMFFNYFVIRGQDFGDVVLENMIVLVYSCLNSEVFNIQGLVCCFFLKNNVLNIGKFIVDI